MKKSILFVLVTMAALAVTSCHVSFHSSSVRSLPDNVPFTVRNADTPAAERQYHVGPFSSLALESAFNCTFVASDSFRLYVANVDQKVMDNIRVNLTDEVLTVGLVDYVSFETLRPIDITVSAPSLASLSMSGACSFECHDTLRAPYSLDLDLSGACKVEVLTFKATRVNVDASGACKIFSNVKADTLAFDASGAVKAALLAIGCQKTYVDMSGAGNVDVEFVDDCGDVVFDASGACKARFAGKVRSLRQDMSGVVKVDTSELDIENH